MKRIKYIFGLLAVTLLGACGMLDLQPVNSMIPTTVEDYESVMVAGYPTEAIYVNLIYMSDDVYVNQNTTQTVAAAQVPFFMWGENPVANSTTEYAIWGAFYKSIFYANSVIDKFREMTPAATERELYETVLGEAHAMRAYSYFYLVNMYADVYSAGNLEKPGVPMPLSAKDVNENISNNTRAPLGKVWEQIAADLEQATLYLKGKTPKSEFRFSFEALQAFKARVYLFTGEWDKSIEAASDVIAGRSLFDMNSLQARINTFTDNRLVFSEKYGFMDTDYSKEVLLSMGGKANNNPFYYWQSASKPDYSIYDLCMRFQGDFTDEDLPVMDVVDYRAYIYCHFIPTTHVEYATGGPTAYNMYGLSGAARYYTALKLSEVYVTRAEAYVRKSSPDKGKAIADLNALLKNRIRSSVFTELRESDFASTDALLSRILEERRLETALDCGLRWFDLRRLGKPEVAHYYDNTRHALAKDDARYLMQIPESEQIASPNMPLNPR